MIDIAHVTFTYRGKPPIFRDFSWSVARGESWSVIGPSGCGKTTLLYLIAGLRFPTSGKVTVAGEAIQRPRPQTGLILQDYGLLPWASAVDNVMLGLKIRGTNGRGSRRAADEWLFNLGLSEVATQYPAELSGGQRQRVAIARTLVLTPDLLLMDEPFAALDALTREGLQALVLRLREGRALTTVLVTHSVEEAVLLGSKILVSTNPPVERAIIIDNSASGSAAYRREPAFYAKCDEVRESVEELQRVA